MGTVYINGKEVEVSPQDNVVQAAQKAGVEIPHYCWHHELSVVASCRMCLVEVGERKPDGTDSMLPRLVPACQTPAKPGTVVRTDSDKVRNSQQQTLEYLLLNHPLDCSICDQAGECYLQDYTYKYGRAESRLQEPKVQRQDKYHIGEQIALFTDRCVMCTRCVRFTREVSGTAELQVINRGSVEEIDVFPGIPCDNKLAGNVVDLCPVGALCSKDFLYKKRVWWLKSAPSVCTGCSTGCSIEVDQNENQVYRLRPRENPLAQGSFMCDDGRFGWKYLISDLRLTAPRIGRQASSDSHVEEKQAVVSDLGFQDHWPLVISRAKEKLATLGVAGGKPFLALFSPFMTIEEAYLLASHLKSTMKNVRLAMGPVPVVGEDDCYPKNVRGEAATDRKVRFTIRAEKCPNRKGVEAVLKHFQSEVVPFSAIENELRQGRFAGAYVVGGYPESPWSSEQIKQLSSVDFLIVQDILKSPLSDAADLLLPGASFAEKEGSVVNHSGLCQSLSIAVRPPGEARSDGRILMELASRVGLFNPSDIRIEMSRTVAGMAALSVGEVGELGTQVL